MCNLKDSINNKLKLSMGMSNDYEIALSNNSNLLGLVLEYLSEKTNRSFFDLRKFKFCC